MGAKKGNKNVTKAVFCVNVFRTFSAVDKSVGLSSYQGSSRSPPFCRREDMSEARKGGEK